VSLTNTASDPTLQVRLTRIEYAALDTNLYVLRRPDGTPLPAAEPGAHIDVHLPDGLIRQYSLIHAVPHPDSYTIGVKRGAEGGGGSRYMHDSLRVGTRLQISTPRNNFPLNESAPHSVLIAGGIGVTPIWSMAERLSQLGHSWEMHYSCRSREDAALLEYLEKLSGVQYNFDDENGGRFLELGKIIACAPAGTHFYCCGPKPMLAAFEAAAAVVPPHCVHVEYFTPKEEAATAGGFTVELARSGKQYFIPAGKTILDTLRAAGLNLPASCERGICGTCETRVIAGVPDHRDSILTAAERRANETMMICCSGSFSDRLVLGL
jgi:tetrachlorobenzoquinone reductase